MKKIFLVISLFLLLTLAYFFPLVKNINNLIVDDYDGLLITWSLNRVARNLPETMIKEGLNWPASFFNANIFYPYSRSHAFSDAFITDGLIVVPFLRLFSEPVAAFNINLILGQWLFLIFTFLLILKVSVNFSLSFLLTLIFGFSKIRFQYLGHLQTFTLYWVPLGFWALLNFFFPNGVGLKKRKSGKIYLCLFFLAFLAQTLNSFLPGFFLILIFLILLLTKSEARRRLKNTLPLFLICLLIVFSILFPIIKIYWSVSKEFGYVRPLSDAVHFSLSPEELFTIFFDWPLCFLFAVSVISYFKTESLKRRKYFPYLLILLTGLLMAFGPFLHWFKKTLPVPLPYLFFYYFVPGFKGFRTPSRWVFLFGLGAVVFAAQVLSDQVKKVFFRWGYLLLIIFWLFSFRPPEKYFSVRSKVNYPPVYSWLKNQKESVILELPIYYWGDFRFGKREPLRMIYSLEHQKKMVNGYSGFSPPDWENLVIKLRREFFSKDNLERIKKIGVDYLLVHEKEFKDLWPEDFESKIAFLKESREFKEIFRLEGDVVYECQ